MKVRKKERTESAAIGLPRKDLRSPSKAVKGGKALGCGKSKDWEWTRALSRSKEQQLSFQYREEGSKREMEINGNKPWNHFCGFSAFLMNRIKEKDSSFIYGNGQSSFFS